MRGSLLQKWRGHPGTSWRRNCCMLPVGLLDAPAQVLRQQGLDYKTWEKEQEDQYILHYQAVFVSDQ